MAQVYILRIWSSSATDKGRAVHRYILEDPFNRARRGFATLQDLTLYLDALQASHRPLPK